MCAGLARRSTESSLSAISGCTPCSAEARRGGAADEAIEDVMTSECRVGVMVDNSLHCPMPIFERAVRRHPPGHQVCPGLGRMVK